MIKWTQIQLQAEIDLVEAIHEIFYNNGFSHIHITKTFKKNKTDWFEIATFMPRDEKSDPRKNKLEQDLGHIKAFDLGKIGPVRYLKIDHTDLSRPTEEDTCLHWISKNMVIKPAYFDVHIPADKTVIQLSASSAFGTGLHPSTGLCIKALQIYLEPQMSVVDIGSGTGILSLVAARLGSRHVTAIDIDAKSYQATLSNIKLNGLEDRITAEHASISDITENFDLVLANLPASLLDKNARYIVRALSSPGILIISGLQQEQYDLIHKKFSQYTLDKIEEIRDNKWISLIYKNKTHT